ncbi:MAG: hypothetical protein MJ209_07495 [archaeon]|nr:hypothetical protein [archaeon]
MARFRKSVDLSAYENKNRKKPPSLAPRGKQNQTKKKPRSLAPRGRAISEGAGFIIPKHNEDLEIREYEEKRRAIRRQSEIQAQQRAEQQRQQQKQAQIQAQQRQQQKQAQIQAQQKSIEQQRNIEERKPINPVNIDQVQKQFLENYSKEENKQKVRKTEKVSSQEPEITEKYQNREQLIEKPLIREEINNKVQIEDIPNNDFVQTPVGYAETSNKC